MDSASAVGGFALCVCTRNRPLQLERLLASVAVGTDQPEEILVSDDSDSRLQADTQAVASRHSRVRYTHGPRRGLAANRNACLANLSQETRAVSFCDDDVEVDSGFVQTARRLQAASDGRTIHTGVEIKDRRVVEPRNPSFLGHQERLPNPDNLRAIVINSTVFPRQVFDTIKFDEALRYGYEELDFAARARHAGYGILFAPELSNLHNHTTGESWVSDVELEANRVYVTAKRYIWGERNYLLALIFGAVAPAHLTGYFIKHHGAKGLAKAAIAWTRAVRLTYRHRKLGAEFA